MTLCETSRHLDFVIINLSDCILSPSDQASLVPDWWQRASSLQEPTWSPGLLISPCKSRPGPYPKGKERQGRGKGKEQARLSLSYTNISGRGMDGGGAACTAGEMSPCQCFSSHSCGDSQPLHVAMMRTWSSPTLLRRNTQILFRFPSFICRLEIVWRCGDAFPCRTYSSTSWRKEKRCAPALLWPWNSNSLHTVVVVCLLPAYEVPYNTFVATENSGNASKW